MTNAPNAPDGRSAHQTARFSFGTVNRAAKPSARHSRFTEAPSDNSKPRSRRLPKPAVKGITGKGPQGSAHDSLASEPISSMLMSRHPSGTAHDA
jgi:hypothetical protein